MAASGGRPRRSAVVLPAGQSGHAPSPPPTPRPGSACRPVLRGSRAAHASSCADLEADRALECGAVSGRRAGPGRSALEPVGGHDAGSWVSALSTTRVVLGRTSTALTTAALVAPPGALIYELQPSVRGPPRGPTTAAIAIRT